MRSVLFHIGFGFAAASGFLLVLFGLDNAGIHVQAAEAAALTFSALTALFFLPVLVTLARLGTEPEAKPVRIRSHR